MYKIYTKSVCTPQGYLRKLLMVMKLTIILIIATIMHVSASSFAQQVTFSKKNATLQQVFNEIKKQTGYRILYSDRIVDDNTVLNVNFRNATLDEVLIKCLKDQALTYVVQPNRSIVLKENELSFLERLASNFDAVDIRGRVLDETGRPVSSVSVRIKGSNKVISTGADGRFNISVPDKSTVLVFSFVGYKSKEVLAQPNMVVSLEPELNKLNEMVVVGYGSIRRKDLTGSVASVSVEEIKNVPFASIDQALTGKASGVQVVQAD